MSNVTLTTSGTSFMATAGTMFPAIPIRYFLPIYDYRIDPYVLPTSGLTSISAAETTSAVSVFGEVIYNIDTISTSAYTITNGEFLIYDANQTGTTTISNNRFNGTDIITLLNGIPLSNAISATSLVYSYPDWTVNGYAIVSGSNVVPTGYASDRDKYFRVTSFAPISCAAGGNSSGLFKVMLDNLKGNFKFNKIALYAARILSGGVEDTSIEPVLVGIAYFNRPIIKSNDGSNLNFVEADIEIQFAASNYFGNTQYLSNTNWNYVGGEMMLWFDGKIAIGTSAIPGSWLGRAKLQITESNEEIPLIRITNDNSTSFIDTFLDNSVGSVIQTLKGSRPEIYVNFETSGTTDYSKITFQGNTDDALRSINLLYVGSTSGSHSTGFDATFHGYLEQLDIRLDGYNFASLRGNDVGTYGTMVLGRGSESLFEHPPTFLTVHGGALLVGSSLVSGSLSGGDLYPNTVYCDGTITSLSQVFAAGGFYTGFIIGTGTGQVIAGRNLSISTSAHFNGPITLGSTLSGGTSIYGYHIFARGDVVATGDILSDRNIRAGVGGTGYISTPNLLVSTSAHFVGPVTIANTLSAGSDIIGRNLYAISDLTVPGFGYIEDLNVEDTLVVGGIFENYGFLINYNNLNTSGLAAFASDLYMDNGDINIRRKGKSILANITSITATGTSPFVATYPNNDSFGIAVGWTGAGAPGNLRINTSKANTGSLIFAMPYCTSTSAPDPNGLVIADIVNGSHFIVERSDDTDTLTVFWFIIGTAS